MKMEINSSLTNGVPDNFETLTSEEIKAYRITYGHYLSPTTILRLLEPRAYFAGLIWELEELLKDRHRYLKSGYNYHSKDKAYSGNNPNMVLKHKRLGEEAFSEEFELNIIKQLFVQYKGNRILSDRQLHVYNTLEPIQSPEVHETDALQTFLSFNRHHNQKKPSAQTSADSNEVTNQEEEQHNAENDAYQNSLECQKEELGQGTQHSNCSDTHNTFECAVSTNESSSGFDDKCDGYVYNKGINSADVSRSEDEYTDSLSVKLEKQNYNDTSDKGPRFPLVLHNKDDTNGSGSSEDTSKTGFSYFVQRCYQTPVIGLNAPSYNMLEHST